MSAFDFDHRLVTLEQEKQLVIQRLKQLKGEKRAIAQELCELRSDHDDLSSQYQRIVEENKQLKQSEGQYCQTLKEFIDVLRATNHDLRLSHAMNEKQYKAINLLGGAVREYTLGTLGAGERVSQQLLKLNDSIEKIRQSLQDRSPGEAPISTAHLTVGAILRSIVPVTDEHTSKIAQKATECLTCGICFEIMEIPHVLPCGHFFHQACLENCTRDCPICRGKLSASRPVHGFGDLAATIIALQHGDGTNAENDDNQMEEEIE